DGHHRRQDDGAAGRQSGSSQADAHGGRNEGAGRCQRAAGRIPWLDAGTSGRGACSPTEIVIASPDSFRGISMKTLMLIVGILALLLGLVWIGQGMGMITQIPSPMIGVMRWTYYGMATAVIGIGLIWYSRR